MGKLVIKKSKIFAKNGGNVTNYDVEIENSELIFEENDINYTTTENIAIIEKYIQSEKFNNIKDFTKLIKELKNQSDDNYKVEKIKNSNLGKKLLSKFKNIDHKTILYIANLIIK